MVESSSSSTSVSKLYASKQAIWRVLGLIAVLIVIVAYNGNSTVKGMKAAPIYQISI